jgi:N-methylhydantoinase A/oxoprolinase/acetone carboxylase beta subunit
MRNVDRCQPGGRPIGITESRIGDFPVRLPVIDIHTVGAGGGSIAYVDSGGALRVGPRSAGSVPGPVCYGAGTELTVTDANLLLGRLDRISFRRPHEPDVDRGAAAKARGQAEPHGDGARRGARPCQHGARHPRVWCSAASTPATSRCWLGGAGGTHGRDR